jgi:hypothetical protein
MGREGSDDHDDTVLLVVAMLWGRNIVFQRPSASKCAVAMEAEELGNIADNM